MSLFAFPAFGLPWDVPSDRPAFDVFTYDYYSFDSWT